MGVPRTAAVGGPRRYLSVRLALQLAGAIPLGVLGGLIIAWGIIDPDHLEASSLIYLLPAVAFYAGLALLAGKLAQARSRRRWIAACSFVSFAMIAMSGGLGGFVVFGPSTAILIVLTIRG